MGENRIVANIPTLVGIPKDTQNPIIEVPKLQNYYIGKEFLRRRPLLKALYPVKGGIIQDWDIFSQFLVHIFDSILHMDPIKHPVFFLVSPSLHPSYRERIIEVFLQELEVPAVELLESEKCIMFSMGITTGVVVDIGKQVTRASAVYEGVTVHGTQREVFLGGDDVTIFLRNLLRQAGKDLSTSELMELDQLKEICCLVTSEPNAPVDPVGYNFTFTNSLIHLGQERAKATDVIFYPELVGKEEPSVPEVIIDLLASVNEDHREEIARSIIIAGGSAQLTGLRERFQKELRSRFPTLYPNSNVFIAPKPQTAAWMGASLIAASENTRDS